MTARSDVTKQKLYDAAIDVIAERGFTGASVDEIVDRAGVAKGTVYYHFAGKAELVEALIADRLSPLAKAMRSAADAHAHDPRAAIDALVRAELAYIASNKAFSKLLLTEMWREDRVWRTTLVLLRSDMLASIGRVIETGVASGTFRAGIDPGFGASALFGMTATTALDWLVFSPERPVDEIAAQITAVAEAALRP